MDPATFVFFLLVFTAVGVIFLFVHLLMGSVIRPRIPDEEKLTIYECGEPTVGSAWVQFDLRYYVVALLFVIFDVEVAFFFPWATVFGTANQLAAIPEERKVALEDKEKNEPTTQELANRERRRELSNRLLPSGIKDESLRQLGLARLNADKKLEAVPIQPEVARSWAQ